MRTIALTSVSIGVLAAGCGTVPTSLARPAQMTCIYLSEPMAQTDTHGLMSIPWETRLERGPYVSERENRSGTYYRAPPGGVRVRIVNSPETEGVRDGGFYLPKDPNSQPKIYTYFSVNSVPAQVPSAGMNCSNIGYINDPSGAKLDVVSVAVGGAIGGAAGGIAGHAASGGGMSYGQAAGAGAAGGMIGMLLVAEIVNADIGNIHFSWDLQDSAFVAKLKELSASKIPIKEIPPQAAAQ